MFFSQVLNRKSMLYSDLFKTEMYDLLSKTFELTPDFNATIYVVEEDEVARMDLVSKHVYGDEMYADVICKVNGISNPYEINKGTMLIMPDPNYLSSLMVSPDKGWNEDIIGDTVNPLYIKGEDTTLGKSSLELRDGETLQTNSVPQPVTKKDKRIKPNQAKKGDKNFRIKGTGNVIIY